MSYFQKIDKLIFKSFIGPYFASFFIAEFVLIMNFLWKYIDNILGKGVPASEILILLGYFSIKILPQAIPISILLSSVFVFGNMAERFELSSMKSAGLSFFRILRSGVALAIFTVILSILTSNIFAPRAEYLFYSKFDTIKKQKSTLFLDPGKINNDFTGFSIYIGGKADDDKTIYDVLIYDENGNDPNLINVISAQRGVMEPTTDGAFLVMSLYDGVQYRELKDKNTKNVKEKLEKLPFTRTKFKKLEKIFDMSQFEMDDGLLTNLSAKERMLNTVQLLQSIDSIKHIASEERLNLDFDYQGILTKRIRPDKNLKPNKTNTPRTNTIPKSTDSATKKHSKSKTVKRSKLKVFVPPQRDSFDLDTLSSFLYAFPDERITDLRKETYNKAKRRVTNINSIHQKIIKERYQINKFTFMLHQKYCWAMICLIFLFIGAPMGSIIRKGGFGYPLLVAILFFVLFVILDITGQKMLKSQVISPIMAAWLPCLIISPASILLTFMALKDFHSFSFGVLFKGLFAR